MRKYFDKQYFISLAFMSVFTFIGCQAWLMMVNDDNIWFSIIYTSIMAPLGSFMARVMSE